MSDRLTNAELKRIEKTFEIFIDSFSGATGGAIASMIFYPIENFRTRLQAAARDQGHN